MRAIQVAILIICIQVFGGIVTASGLFTGTYYESSIVPSQFGNASAQYAHEQEAVAFDVMNALWNTLTWGWITQYFEPVYSSQAGARAIIDAFILGLNGLSWTLIGIAFLQYLRNLIQPLQSG